MSRGIVECDFRCCTQLYWNFRESNSKEFILRFLAAEPVEAYAHVFGAFGDNSIICDPRGG